MSASFSPSRKTRGVRAAVGADLEHGAVMPPIYLSANFTFEGLDGKRRYDYTRSGNPTRDHLAEAIAAWESGTGAVVTSSGMSAILLALQLLPPGARVAATRDCYGGTHRLLLALARKQAIEPCFLDLSRREGLDELERLRPALVWLETPSNPLLRITDLRAVATAAHACGALLAVDNTLLGPALQRPLEHGADLVVHSTTKFLNGHSDVVGGAVVAADAERLAELAWWANCLGITGAPFDSYLTLRGLRTLDARVRVHQENAAAIAAELSRHPAIERVHYPGLADHPGHLLAAAQQDGFGSLLSFELAGGVAAVAAFVGGLECFSLAESLGGVESLVAHPASMTHAAMTPEARAAAGISDSLLRLSVGIESVEDLLDDLGRALQRAERAVRQAVAV
jgi:cystathionine gamma-synthase